MYSFKYAFLGILESFKVERNMKIHFTIAGVVIAGGFYFHINSIEWILCLICFGLVLSAEMMNTAIEAVTDIASPSINPKAKLAKDAAAGGVLVMAIISLIIGFIIFLPKILA